MFFSAGHGRGPKNLKILNFIPHEIKNQNNFKKKFAVLGARAVFVCPYLTKKSIIPYGSAALGDKIKP